MDKFFHIRRVNLLILSGKHHGHEVDDFQMTAKHVCGDQKRVDDISGRLDRLREQTELSVSVGKPVNKNAAHIHRRIQLFINVKMARP